MSWQTVELAAVADINPRMPRGLADNLGVSFLPMAAVSEAGQIDYHEERTVEQVRKGYTYFRRGDVLIAKITPCFENGKATKTDALDAEHGFGSTEFHVIRGNPSELLSEYAFHLIWNPYFRKEATANMTGSAGQKRVPADFLKRLKIPLPPLEEQRRIAAILDAADALRRRRREALALLDTLPGAIFAEMFGDIAGLPSVPFGQVIHDIGNGVSPSRAGTVEDEVLTLSAVTGVTFDASKRKSDKFAGAIPAGKRVETGDFLLCRGNGNPDLVGSAKLADNTGEGFVYPDTIMRAKLNEARVVSGYVASLWKHNHIRDQITAGARTTNGTMKINQTTVKNIEIPLPDLASQAKFARRASEIEAGIKAQQFAHLSELEALFASLQSRAFAGEL